MSTLAEGSNCWRISRARRAAFIIDGEDYFGAVHEALSRARRSVFIIGWDIHSELRLVRGDRETDDPTTLGRLLDARVRACPDLHVYILSWDFAMIYAMEREFFPRYKLRWKSHRRIRFCLDGEHPPGASQHQKLVVVDDQIAFSGGIDLSKWRWDTSAHEVEDARRIDPDGQAYPPFHDIQMLVDGQCAAALGELARERWRLAGDVEPVSAGSGQDNDAWPPRIEADLHDVDVGVARTFPRYKQRDEIREVERLYLDSIASAKRFIYIENQYFTSHAVAEAIAERLEQAEGPEIVIVMPFETGGWLEQHTMDVLRARVLKRLREADRHERLSVYYVRLAKKPHLGLMVHAKLMIVDDRFVRIGSSNLSNRSMGFDSECDLVIEAGEGPDIETRIRALRHRLLAEHLDVDADTLAKTEAEHPSLKKLIEALQGDERTLMPLKADIAEDVDTWVPDAALLDPERPVEPEVFLENIVGPQQKKGFYRRLLKLGALVAGVLALAAAWRWTPLSTVLNPDSLSGMIEWLDAQPFTPVWVLLVYVLAGFAGVPITLMFIATVMAFGPVVGFVYALAGAELSALTSFATGRMLGRSVVRRIAGSRVNRLSRKLSERGVFTTLSLRIVPVAPFSVINIVAGISDIRLRDFALGSLIGLLPGILASAVLTDRLIASLRDPSPTQILILLGLLALVIVALGALRHRLRRKRDTTDT